MQYSSFTVEEMHLIKSVMERVCLEVSLRNLFQPIELIVSRLCSAVANGERDEEVLRAVALQGAVHAPPPLPSSAYI
jgi:hypothetical protein